MPFIEALRLALSSVWSHKLRSFLTLLGVIFGVATVIVVVSLVEGFNAYVDEKIANIGTNAFIVQKFSDRKSTRLNSSHANISYAVFCLKKKKTLQSYSDY